MAVTLADVAARAGVSSATVSRVLSGNYPVADATRNRVLRAVDELEYVVNGPASALAAASSDLLGILVNDIADPFFGIIASAVQGELEGRAYGGPVPQKLAVVCNTGGSPERELTYLTLLQRQRAAAVVLTGGAVEDPEHSAALATRLRRLAAGGTRIVLCGRPPLEDAATAREARRGTSKRTASSAPVRSQGAAGAVLTVAFDNRGGAHALTTHLLTLGHRHIGYVAGPAERTTTRHRLEGHRAALEAHGGLDADRAERLTVHGGGYDRSSGYEGTRELLRRAPETTAVLAANDTVALGVCAALREMGLRVPQDVSVAGFDDLPFSADASPALTTVRLPLHEAGARAGQLALGTLPPPQDGMAAMGHELVVRASTAPPRAGG
ncbi:LacI family DNA-binding transcriptional regulator [Streptomyces oryzae]|uniref:LacI family DNA-binding transcriptional regulator n=1 Tax=Streptomyces oryzae TaxID=1434886 RepID=A0ABS3XFS3_9ACTN|nr:LacI family DNA-binding transcriptional regulator [Streptomyces oryzae]MBO8194246.1 LacI family DNA-binding transcriptional regulator [Streptomyces oryzae]